MSRRFDDVLMGSIELFCLAAERGSFTGAATVAGLTPAAVSRSVARLEQRLGVRLFTRTTRQVRLTEAGAHYLRQCRQALNQLLEAERELTGQQLAPSGRVRISVPTSYGHHRLLPRLHEFGARYPDVEIDVQISNHNVNFYEDDFDLAIRARPPSDSALIARPLETSPLIVVATPDYLRQHGTPQTPDDLSQHECIQFVLPRSGRTVPWEFRINGEDVDLMTAGRLRVMDDILGCVTLARAGAGLYQPAELLVSDDLRSGRLVEVLQAYRGRGRHFTLIWPQNRHLPLRVRVLVDFLVNSAAANSGH